MAIDKLLHFTACDTGYIWNNEQNMSTDYIICVCVCVCVCVIFVSVQLGIKLV